VERVRILLAEDQALVREALAALLSLQPGFTVVAQVGTGREAIEAALALRPDVALLDIEMPDGDGIEAARALHASAPDVRCLILTTFAKDDYLIRAIEAGAFGYLLKDAPAADLARAIHEVLKGNAWISPAAASRIAALKENAVSERERTILRLLAAGRTNREIAAELFLAEGTVKNLVSALLLKLSARNRTELVQAAREKGLI
jgi:two-component system response regulator DesR